ncbi:MAG: hypothetical protein WCD21_39350 [Streptomyces sp.]
MWNPSAGLHETRYTVPSALHSTVAVPPVNRRVDRSLFGGVLFEGDGEVEGGVDGEVEADGRPGVGGDAFVAARALSTAPSSSGRLCAATPLSDVANCQAPSAPAAVPIATHAAVTAALRHFLIRPLCRTVS